MTIVWEVFEIKLNLDALKDIDVWESVGFKLPKFNIEHVKANTKTNPNWIHFGAGNIFRAFMANVQQNILNEGKSGKGEYFSTVVEDFENGPESPFSYIGQIASLVYERYLYGKQPIALVSMDNMSHNGTKLYESVSTYAKKWVENGIVDEGFQAYISDPKSVSFPWSMIDKITPRPDPSVRKMLSDVGFEDVEGVITSKNSFVSPFVNAEESEYLIIEDIFPNGRPNLEEGGIIFTDRETVDKVEKMKVCTCLNPLHTALAIFGCLLGYDKISKEMEDPELKTLVEKIGYVEGFPVVVNPGIIDPKKFIDEVLQVTNIALGDMGPFHGLLKPILSNANIFGVNLYEAGLGERVEGYFTELVSEKGAVRKTLKKYVY